MFACIKHTVCTAARRSGVHRASLCTSCEQELTAKLVSLLPVRTSQSKFGMVSERHGWKAQKPGHAASVAGGCNKLTLKVSGNASDSVVIEQQGLEAWELREALNPADDIV